MDTSVSAVEKFEMCPSLWAFPYVHNDWAPQSAAAAEGDELHLHHQNWFQKGIRYDDSVLGRLAAAALPFLPDRVLDDPISEEIVNIPYGKHTYKKNKIDLSFLAPRGPYVIDYKKAKDRRSFMRYGLSTKQKLRSNHQACAYGYYIMKKFGTDFVHLSWLYHLVEEMEVVPVEVTIDIADAKAVLLHHNASIDAMDAIKKVRLPMAEVAKASNGAEPGDACEAFSGCYYAPKCGVTLRPRKQKT